MYTWVGAFALGYLTTCAHCHGEKDVTYLVFFVVCEDTKYAKCNDFLERVSHGGKTTMFNTSNLVTHLKKHADRYTDYLKKSSMTPTAGLCTSESKSKASKQVTLAERYNRTQVWDINDRRAQHVHQKIGEMIVLDLQPISVMEDEGFTALIHTLEPRYTLPSRKYFTDTVLTRIHKGIVSKVEEQIANVDLFSFTTDIWSTEVSNYSMISLTAHWITDHFEKKSAVLHVQSFPESHQHWKNNL